MSLPIVDLRLARNARDIERAHRLFRRRIGKHLVEDCGSFRESATVVSDAWAPLLLIAIADGVLAGAQLGGLLTQVGAISLPYSAVGETFEGQGLYTRLKGEMIARLRAMAAERGVPAPRFNLSEEVRGSAQYERKVVRGRAVELPVRYVQPARLGVPEVELALTLEPLTGDIPSLSRDAILDLIAAMYRALYRISDPWRDNTFQRVAATAGALHGAHP